MRSVSAVVSTFRGTMYEACWKERSCCQSAVTERFCCDESQSTVPVRLVGPDERGRGLSLGSSVSIHAKTEFRSTDTSSCEVDMRPGSGQRDAFGILYKRHFLCQGPEMH